MDSVEIISLAPSEWEDYKNIRLRALREEPQAYETKYIDALNEPSEEWEKRLAAAELGKTQWLSFAKQENNLVGMAAAFSVQGSNTANVVSVFVAKEVRGQGISKKLMNHLMSKIKRNDLIKTLRLEVNPAQIPALKLYEGLGFKKIGTVKNKLGDGKEYEDLLMELSLT